MPKWVETSEGYFEPVYTREDVERLAPKWRGMLDMLSRARGEGEPEPDMGDEGASER